MNDTSTRHDDLFDQLRQHPRCVVSSAAGTGTAGAVARYVAEVAQQNEDQSVAVISMVRALVGQWTTQVSQHSDSHVGAISSTADLIEVLDEQRSLPTGVTVLAADLLHRKGTTELLAKSSLKLLVISDLQAEIALRRILEDLVDHADRTVLLIQEPLGIPSWASEFHDVELDRQPTPLGPRRHVYKITQRELSIFREAERVIEEANYLAMGLPDLDHRDASSWPILHQSLLSIARKIDREIPASDMFESFSGEDDPYLENLLARAVAVAEQVESMEDDRRLGAVLAVIANANGRPCVVSVAAQLEAHYIAGFLTDNAQDATLVLDSGTAATVFSGSNSELPQVTISTERSLLGVELPADSLHLIWSVSNPEVSVEWLRGRGGELILLVSDPALPPDERVDRRIPQAR